MNDRELLELAAKAIGKQYVDPMSWDEGAGWNPLEDDGDALRLAVKLLIDTHPDVDGAYAETSIYGETVWASEFANDGDLYTATRRAIVRTAAEIGRNMS